jgi:hypothetical protein
MKVKYMNLEVVYIIIIRGQIFLLFFHCSFVLVVTCIGTSCTGSVLIKFAVIKKKEGKIKRKLLTYIHVETNTFFGIIFEKKTLY